MIRISQIKIPIKENTRDKIILECSRKLRINKSNIESYKINKRSIDARKKPDLFYVYELDLVVKDEEVILRRSKDIRKTPKENYKFEIFGSKRLKHRPIIVGSGPCGLFCSYFLAEAGYNPLIVERGEKIEDREKSIERFFETGVLDPNSNIQFGEGGAGTFSDGKLNTLVKDKKYRQKRIFEILVENGAPEEILYESKPHIGTDILRNVIKNIRNKIISMGGDFLFNTTLTDINISDGKVVSVVLNNDREVDTDILVLALGHSARDTFKILYEKGINITSKPFAVGVRVQHLQKDIDRLQYGEENLKFIGKASYKLTYQTKNKRGVYTFCMCPGGYVLNASSEKGHLAVNGMSNHERESENANSAVIVTVSKRDYGEGPLAGIRYQRLLEEKAFKLGNGAIPIQTLGDFKLNKETDELGKIKPVIKGKYKYSNLRDVFSSEISSSIIEAMDYFDHKIAGFGSDDVILAAVESRTSSPIRIIRDDDLESNIEGIYPAGEGAGYAGGITSAAIDGVKVAEAISRKFIN